MKIAFIGGGNMGATYARAFVRSRIIEQDALLIVEKSAESRSKLKKEKIAEVHEEIDSRLADYDFIFLAVKPQDFLSIVPALKQVIHRKQVIISIMAGIKITSIKELLDHENIIRAMPNTPAQLGFGITGFAAGKGVSQNIISKVDTLLETTGKSIFMKNEKMLDAVTAISGSGPAYFFYFAKYMIDAGKELGLESHVAEMLVKQTMLGSFQMLNNSSASPDELIASVKSKGGTTEAALTHFDNSEIGENIIVAIKAAENRAKELSVEVLK
jgi:pyrroline-5-carboxylate reductase